MIDLLAEHWYAFLGYWLAILNGTVLNSMLVRRLITNGADPTEIAKKSKRFLTTQLIGSLVFLSVYFCEHLYKLLGEL